MEYRCKYCGTRVSGKQSDICGGCYTKLKLVKQLRQICDKIKGNTKQTNYDRIRNMSVEELADVLVANLKDLGRDNFYHAVPTHRTYISKTVAKQKVIEWLESEVSE